MPIPRATLTLTNGSLGIPAEQTDGVIVIFGYCSAGTTGTLYSFDAASPSKAKSDLGVGKAAQLAASILATPNHGLVYVMPLASSAGSNTAISASGTSPPTVTLSGTPHDDYRGKVEILTAGARGTATFRYSLDNGTNWSVELLTAATYTIPESGLTLNFAVGSYVADNRYSWTSTAPSHSNTNVTDGIDAVIAAGLDFGWGVVLAAPGGATDADRATALASQFSAVGTKADALETAYKYVGFTIEAGFPVDSSTSGGMSAWRSALTAAAPALSHKRMMIAASPAVITSDIDGRDYVRSAAFAVAPRISAAPISEHLGRVRSGALRGVVSLIHDEESTGGLDSFRFTTLRTIAGRPGFFITRGRQFDNPGGDYQSTQNLRVINSASKTGRNAILSYLNDDLIVSEQTGRIREDEAAAIDIDLTSQLEATLIKSSPQHASSVNARVSRTDNILQTGTLSGEFSVIPKGYAEAINFTLGFARAFAAAA